MSRCLPLLFCVFFLFYTSVFSQNPEINSLDSLSGQLIKTIRSHESEQSYITTDKSLYKSGEEVWFRVFLLKSISQKVSRHSKNLFIDLVNEKDSVLNHLVLNNRRQQLTGRMVLNDTAPTGYYWLRAYTKQMADKDSDKAFVHSVYILNQQTANKNLSNNNETFQNDAKKLKLEFFPEGGSIITGANSVVSIHITDKEGHPLSVSGYVKDSRDSVASHFETNENGLGKFTFYPSRFRKYTAHIVSEGKDDGYPLPPFNFFAGQLSITSNDNGSRTIRVLLEDSIYKKDFITYIIGISKDSLCFASKGTGMYELPIYNNKFPNGIATFFLLDQNLKMLSERSVYITDGNLNVKADFNKAFYKKRDKATLSISVTDQSNQPVLSSLSISVADSLLIQPQNSQMLLTGYFENEAGNNLTNWFLKESADLSDKEMDLIMLCRKNTFPDIVEKMTHSALSFAESDSLLYIKGKVVNNKNEPVVAKVVTLFFSNRTDAFYVDTTDANGRFIFPLTDYPDSSKFNIQVSTIKGEVLDEKILLDPFTLPKLISLSKFKKQFEVSNNTVDRVLALYTDTLNYKKAGYLKPVTVKTYKKEANYDVTKRISQFSKIVTSDMFNNGGYGSIANALLTVPGLHLLGNSFPLVVLDGISLSLSSSEDIVPTASPVVTYLKNLNPQNIDFVEVLTGPEAAVYGARSGNGVILINTRTKFRDDPKKQTTLKSFFANGYDKSPVFKMPDYNKKEMRKSPDPDNRSTLYWNGNILTDSTGKVNIDFFTSDISTVYKVSIKGITKYGDIIYKTFTFQTKEFKE